MHKTVFRALLLGTVAVTVPWVGPARADDVSQLRAELEALKAQNEALNARLDQILEKTDAAATAAAAAQKAADSAQKQQSATPQKSVATTDPTANDALVAIMGPPDTDGSDKSAAVDGVPVLQIYNNPKTRLGVYGIIDATISTKTNYSKKDTYQTAFDAGWFTGSRWGMTGSHQIGNGTDVIFKLEGGYDTTTGDSATENVIFDRDAWVGFYDTDWGKFTFGRQNALARDFIRSWASGLGNHKIDLGESGWFTQSAMLGLQQYGGSATGNRQDAGVVWKKVTDRWVTGLSYQFGGLHTFTNSSNTTSEVSNANSTSGSADPGMFSRGSSASAAISYYADTWDANTTVTHANISGFAHNMESAGVGTDVLGPIRLQGGYIHYTADQAVVGTRSDNIFTLGAAYKPDDSKFRYIVNFYSIETHNGGATTATGSIANPFTDTSQFVKTSGKAGRRNTLYGGTYYSLDDATTLYLLSDYQAVGGKQSLKFSNSSLPSTTSKDGWEIGTGMFYKF